MKKQQPTASGYQPQNEILTLQLDVQAHAKVYEHIPKGDLPHYSEWKPIREALAILKNPHVTTANEYLNRMEYRLRLAQRRLARQSQHNDYREFLQEKVNWYLVLMAHATNDATTWDIWQTHGTAVDGCYRNWENANKRAEELTRQTGKPHEWVRQGSRREKQLMKLRDEKGNKSHD